MIKLADFIPLNGQYIHEEQFILMDELLENNINTLYLKDPILEIGLISSLKKLLKRKRAFTIYIESVDNHIIKEELKKELKRDMVSYIYNLEDIFKETKLTIYDYVRADLQGSKKNWDALVRFSEKNPCIYLISNAPDIDKVKTIPGNFRFM